LLNYCSKKKSEEIVTINDHPTNNSKGTVRTGKAEYDEFVPVVVLQLFACEFIRGFVKLFVDLGFETSDKAPSSIRRSSARLSLGKSA
jgi:hypothetical protein